MVPSSEADFRWSGRRPAQQGQSRREKFPRPARRAAPTRHSRRPRRRHASATWSCLIGAVQSGLSRETGRQPFAEPAPTHAGCNGDAPDELDMQLCITNAQLHRRFAGTGMALRERTPPLIARDLPVRKGQPPPATAQSAAGGKLRSCAQYAAVQNVNRSHACKVRAACQLLAWPKPEAFGLRREKRMLPFASNGEFTIVESVVLAT
jgi:hypothetical protein